MEKEDEVIKNIEQLEALTMSTNKTIFRYKIYAVFFGIYSLGLFVLYYYIHAPIISYIIVGIVNSYVLYIVYIRLSELRIINMNISIYLYDYKVRCKRGDLWEKR